MNIAPKFDLVYLFIIVGIIFIILQFETLTTESLMTSLAFFDVVVGFILIIKGFVKWDMSYIFTGAFCALCSYYSYKEMSDFSLFFLILGGIVGVGNHVRKTFKNTIGRSQD